MLDSDIEGYALDPVMALRGVGYPLDVV